MLQSNKFISRPISIGIMLFIACILLINSSTRTKAADTAALTGINHAAAEFGNCSDRETFPTVYPELINSADYHLDKGVNVFRLPFCWERLQHVLDGSFHDAEIDGIHSYIDHVTAQGAHVILDVHNYARYDGHVIGESGSPVTKAHFADLWARLANEFGSNSLVIFGLMNEPHDMSTDTWVEDANAAIAAIRNAGANNLILVPGNSWTGAMSWYDDYYGTPNAIALLNLVDPHDHFAIEVHQYLDANNSGNDTSPCVSSTVGSERLLAFTNWLKDHELQGFLGEFGVGTDSVCLAALEDMLSFIDNNTDVWLGWTYWAGGPWWGSYNFSVEPTDGNDQPQMAILSQHLATAPITDPPPNDNQIINGDFAAGMNAWLSFSDNTIDTSSGAMCIDISIPGANPWDVIVAQAGIGVLNGSTYQLGFDARADQPTQMKAKIGLAEAPWSNYYLSPSLGLQTSWEHHTFTFEMAEASDPGSRLEFQMGGELATVICIDDVTFTAVEADASTPEPPVVEPTPTVQPTPSPVAPPSSSMPENNILVNGDFGDGSANWFAGGFGNVSAENNTLCVTIDNPKTYPWDAILGQNPFTLHQGHDYHIEFDIWSAQSTTLDLRIARTTTYFLADVDTDTGWQHMVYDFTMNEVTTDQASFEFQMGGELATEICIANVQLIDTTQAENLLENGDFSNGVSSWFAIGGVDPSTDSGELCLSITNAGSNAWDVIAGQSPHTIEIGTEYTVSFDARASRSTAMNVKVGMSRGPWANYLYAAANLSSNVQHYAYTFTMNQPTDTATSFEFHLGGQGNAEVCIDNVVLQQSSP